MKGFIPSPKGRRFGMIGILGVVALMLVAFVAWLGRPAPAQANSNDLANFTNRYPSATKLADCSTCHTSSIPALNPYGSDYKSNGRNAAALATIESKDSDGDGYTNIQEINAQTNPGDPASHPSAVTPQPTSTTAATPMPTPTTGTVLRIPIYIPIVESQ